MNKIHTLTHAASSVVASAGYVVVNSTDDIDTGLVIVHAYGSAPDVKITQWSFYREDLFNIVYALTIVRTEFAKVADYHTLATAMSLATRTRTFTPTEYMNR